MFCLGAVSPKGLSNFARPLLWITKTARKTSLVRQLLGSLRTNGLVATVQLSSIAMQRRLPEHSAWRVVFLPIDKTLDATQQWIDGRFDRKYGTDTSRVVALSDLSIADESVKFGHRYEPTSVRVFDQIMSNIKTSYADFEFVDFGSGKARILLLASRYRFTKIVGVEFAPTSTPWPPRMWRCTIADAGDVPKSRLSQWTQPTSQYPIRLWSRSCSALSKES